MARFRWGTVAAILLGAGLPAAVRAQEIVVLGRPEKTEQWVQKLLIWRSWHTPGSKDPAQTRKAAQALVEGIDDPAAIPAIIAFLKVEKHASFRRTLIWPLIQMGGKDAVATLVKLSVLDENPYTRREVAEALACRPELPDFLDQYIGYLYKPNLTVAAAQALRWNRLATRDKNEPLDPKLAKALIAALVQKHEKRLPFSRTFGGVVPVSVELPQDVRWVGVQVPTPNADVYEILKEYSYEDHGYHQVRWTRSLIYGKRR